MQSKLIILDGLDGCGKSTQLDLLKENFPECRFLTFPNYNSPTGEIISEYLAGKIPNPEPLGNAYSASSFYAVDRYASFKQFWEKDYKNGTFILAARYVTSNLIYQMSKLDKRYWNEFTDWLYDYEYERLGLPKPDKVIFLDMPLEVSQRLLADRYNGDESKKDIHEADMEYMKRCRDAAYFSADKLGWEIIDCSDGSSPLPIKSINEKIIQSIFGTL